MKTFDNYYKVLTTISPEEQAVRDEITRENERFENTPEYKEHWDKVQALMKKEHDLFTERLNQAKKSRPERRRFKTKAIPVTNNKPERDPKVDALVNEINALPHKDKTYVGIACFSEDIPVDTEKSVNKEDLNELHEILVQTVLDYIKEKSLSDVYSVSFSADSLQESAEYGMWCPATDSYLELDALRDEPFVASDGSNAYRTIIGKSY